MAPDDETLDYFLMLPEHVIHHILSFLPFEEIVRSSVLSKTWNGMCSNYPNVDLVFNTERYFVTPALVQLSLDKIERILDQCLYRKKKLHIFKLSIEVSSLDWLEKSYANMDRWLRAAISRNVSELVVKVPSSEKFKDGPPLLYSIPEDVFLVSALKVVDLRGCLFEDRFTHIELPHLQTFTLFYCQFAGENILKKILRGCPALEFLGVFYSKGVGSSLSVSCKPRLNCFSLIGIEELKSIEISAPSLETFECTSMTYCAPNLASCTALKCLQLLDVDNVPIHYLLSKLLYIEKLVLYNCEFAVDRIKISSLCLKKLEITSDWAYFPCTEIDAPNLLSLELTALGNCSKNQRFISWNVPNVEKIQMQFQKSFWIFCKAGLEDFLKKLHNFDDLKLLIYDTFGKRWIIHEKLSAVCFSSLKKLVKKGKGELYVSILSSFYSYLRDTLDKGHDRLSLVFSSRDSIEMLHKRLSADMSKYHWFDDFEFVLAKEEIEHPHCVWESFLKTNSTGYHTATLFQSKKIPPRRI